MTEAIVKNSCVHEAATASLVEPKEIETENVLKNIYVIKFDFTGKDNFYYLRNSKTFDFWKDSEEDIY